MKTRIVFFGRIVLAWLIAIIVINMFASVIGIRDLGWAINIAAWVSLALMLLAAASHLHRVQSISHEVDISKLENRHRRQIEIPFASDIALKIISASLHELPQGGAFKATRDGMRFVAKLEAIDPESTPISLWRRFYLKIGIAKLNQVIATANSSNGTLSVTLVSEPDSPSWMDWLFLDEGSNLQNIETVTQAITRRIGEHRRGEEAATRDTVSEKEVAVAKLNLLYAQVEPHFLYNTLGSAKYLISTDPSSAEAMIDNLIAYLRHSLPRGDSSPSTLSGEIARAKAYLDILKIRMGDRLSVQLEIPEDLADVPFPAMMLQTLVENSINHGLEPKSGGGTIWISARKDAATNGDSITVTVADDGIGFGSGTSGTGIGLQNVRERLKLAYNGTASFAIVANFPQGVAASISVPVSGPINQEQVTI